MSDIQLEAKTNAHPTAMLAVSGILIKQDRERFEKALHQHGGEEFKKKITIRYDPAPNPERRVHVNLEGLSPTLLAWFDLVIKQALADCGHAHCKVCVILLSR